MFEFTIIALICFVAFIWYRANRVMLDDILSPFNLLLFFWILPLLLSFLNLSSLQEGLSSYSLFLVICVTLIMGSVSLIPMLIKVVPTTLHSHPKISSAAWASSGLRIIVVLFFAMALSATYFAEFYGAGVPLLQYAEQLADVSDLHRIGKDSKLQIIAFALPIAGTFCFAIALTSRTTITKLTFFTLSSVPVVLAILKTSKSDLYLCLLNYFAVYYYLRGFRGTGFQYLRVAMIVGTLACGMLLLTSLRLEVSEITFYSEIIDFKYKDLPFPLNELLAIAYGYSALNFENFSRYVSHADEVSRIGTSLFRPFLSMLMQGNVADSMLSGVDLNYFLESANVGTFLRDLYVEGGAVLCILGALIYSLLTNAIYLKFRLSRSLVWMFLYINFLLPWTWIAFNNWFSILGIYANAVYVVLAFAAAKAVNALFSVRNDPKYSKAQGVPEVQGRR